jgi:hypothetical protein
MAAKARIWKTELTATSTAAASRSSICPPRRSRWRCVLQRRRRVSLFVNIFGEDVVGSGGTMAITGPWERGAL